LKITHAALNDSALDELGDALNANVLDLGSNNFSWDRLLPQLSQCRWLNLQRTALLKFSYRFFHKILSNSICTKMIFMNLPQLGHVERLKSLSIYRNQVEIFDWPAGQTIA
jgi:hypothetical protein